MWRNVLPYKPLEVVFSWWIWYRLEFNCNPEHSGYRYNFKNICLWLEFVKLLPYESAGNADTERWTSHFAHDITTAPYMIINNEGYNDDDNNNNTINNWHEEQSRQKVLLLGEIIRSILCTFCLLIWADACLLWSVKWNVVLRILRECGCGLLQLSPGTESRSNWKVQAGIANCPSMAFLIKNQ